MMARVCDSGTNCTCEVEPSTGLVENRSALEYEIRRRMERCKTSVYGQKDPAYYTEISWLYRIFKCKFIYLIRNREEVAKSIYNWQRFFTNGIKTDSVEKAGELWDHYNNEISEHLMYISRKDYFIVRLDRDNLYAQVHNTLNFLNINFDKDTIYTLYHKRINSPEERGFV